MSMRPPVEPPAAMRQFAAVASQMYHALVAEGIPRRDVVSIVAEFMATMAVGQTPASDGDDSDPRTRGR